MTDAEVEEALRLRWLIGITIFILLVMGAIVLTDRAPKGRPVACPCGCRPK